MSETDVIDELCEANGQENAQIDAASFLPLMLQAQDLVSKLESRVVELENDLENINEMHEQERNQLLQEIGEKDEYIHELKTKNSRLEYGAQSQFLDNISLCLNYLKSAQNNQKGRKSSKKSSLLPIRFDTKVVPSNNESDYKVDLVIPKLVQVSNNVVNNIVTNDDYINNNRLVHHDNSRLNSRINSRSNSRRDSICGSQISLDDIPDLDEYDLDGSEDIADFDALLSDDDNCHEITDEPEEIDYDDDDDDLISNDILRPSSSVSKSESFCSSCNTLLAQVDQHIEERAYLKRDLSALAISLAEEKALCAKIQSSKESLEQEIDDWINGMFVKLNQMVFDEANTCEEIECLNRETKGKLESILKSSGNRQDRLREMKSLLVHLDSIKQRQAVPALNTSRNSVLHRSLSNSLINNQRFTKAFGHMSPSIFTNKNPFDNVLLFKGKRLYIDGIIFEEFQEYVKLFINSVPPTSSTPTHPFMKRCMNEDIQPCLFEGSTGWKSPFYKRRLLDAIMKNQCEIQAIHSSFSTTVSTSSSTTQVNSPIDTQSNYDEPPPAPKLKCGLCGHTRSCDFRMRISDSDVAVPPSTTSSSLFSVTGNPGWIPIDRFCRDRVVAVCDFYAFLSHLRQGLFSNSPVWGMYKQCLKYRRKMCMARVGSVSMFEEEDAISNDYLSKSEMEGMVVIVH
ncbi:3158_t:CDS:2 [Dentiscutata erythropus]|uniref:3158_t:CDS:1 n=1 Tax=Dentiscutata erythropus TaxID=1348616 RepID=A0A9N9ERB9_9GLOM|nr:3158_t:CDS:2 [Dentiscutata erythropus]